ncbi:MAG TPA: DUF938 domain-containing protein, partial [Vampirovibrionales bacterium]
RTLHKTQDVLEIGSGSGQHALYFSEHLPHLTWQATDTETYLNNLQLNILESKQNIPKPFLLDVSTFNEPPPKKYDAVFSANTLHIMSWEEVTQMFNLVEEVTKQIATLYIYGPFYYEGKCSSPSNQEFDKWLKQRNPESGIRNFEDVNELAIQRGFQLKEDNLMPANNQLLVWVKS